MNIRSSMAKSPKCPLASTNNKMNVRQNVIKKEHVKMSMHVQRKQKVNC